ncbi:MAG: DNA adenine methylase [Candidatus Marinimicrobia bacterium]|nr:DNA adenine methylase [Candidatus Neomarinimicrobiota bacterium]MCF7829364.1 DNA adenine methylase [Candidatus Neomarinimicrobiota bacterium]MCF7880850.1 DNA adenine methylase [Candidatus Neomarinimicrobiota bacterium]
MPKPKGRRKLPRPFLKWAGGKTQLLDAIQERLPATIRDTGRIHRYVEPFLGGGAVFFYLHGMYELNETYLCDINRELIVGYKTIQKEHTALIDRLKEIETAYLDMSQSDQKTYYYQIRNRYNDQVQTFDYARFNPEWIHRAAMLIFLNKTCYNGLFRQNQQGEFNVPHGQYVNPTICDEKNLRAVHEALQQTTVVCGDYKVAEQFIDDETFVYFDPPYRPLNKTSSFTSYFKSNFTDEDQRQLADFFHEMNKRGAKQILNNSDPKNENASDEFFDELYAGESITIERVPAKRFINSDASGRGEINELIIYNY